MRALILAGGKGSRLKPFTFVIPKPLVPIGEMPVLELGRLLVRELRCIGRPHEQHQRVPVELHAAN